MDVKIKVEFYSCDSNRSYSCFITLSTVLYSRYFLNDDFISYEVLSTLISSRTLSRIKPLFFTKVRHLDNGNFVVDHFFRFRVLSIRSL